VTGALLLGQWPEAAMVMVLFTVAELIEAKSLDRARNAIQGLMQLTPERATVLQAEGSWQDVAAKTVAVDARVRIKPGERIALDGTITNGRSTINQSAITGESLPVEKAEGDPVFAGTVNEAGSFEYTVTAAANDSTLARIIHAVEQAHARPRSGLSTSLQRSTHPPSALSRWRLPSCRRCCWVALGLTGSTRHWCCW
jgi:Cd2+/Zn2+-exporting ATPase